MEKIFILRVNDTGLFSELFVGAVISNNPFVAQRRLMSEFKSETGDDPENVELLEFPIQNLKNL